MTQIIKLLCGAVLVCVDLAALEDKWWQRWNKVNIIIATLYHQTTEQLLSQAVSLLNSSSAPHHKNTLNLTDYLTLMIWNLPVRRALRITVMIHWKWLIFSLQMVLFSHVMTSISIKLRQLCNQLLVVSSTFESIHVKGLNYFTVWGLCLSSSLLRVTLKDWYSLFKYSNKCIYENLNTFLSMQRSGECSCIFLTKKVQWSRKHAVRHHLGSKQTPSLATLF